MLFFSSNFIISPFIVSVIFIIFYSLEKKQEKKFENNQLHNENEYTARAMSFLGFFLSMFVSALLFSRFPLLHSHTGL